MAIVIWRSDDQLQSFSRLALVFVTARSG